MWAFDLGILPLGHHACARASAYSIRGAIDEAIKCKTANEKKVIAFNVTGHGFLDLPAYMKVL
jgi:tryptophan synthase beta chain